MIARVRVDFSSSKTANYHASAGHNLQSPNAYSSCYIVIKKTNTSVAEHLRMPNKVKKVIENRNTETLTLANSIQRRKNHKLFPDRVDFGEA